MALAAGQKGAVSNLILLDVLSEERINDNLRNRHAKDNIYTYIGNVLISVNPFRNIQGMYSSQMVDTYNGRYLYENPPHIFGLSEETYRNLVSTHLSQCVIITGESGAGKTEASKQIMQYIAAVSGNIAGQAEVQRVKDQLLSSNPVLESLGNAKTLRNDNSSRFGKYLEILFDPAGDPIGGRIRSYLLEKSRVVNPARGERSFHIFYFVKGLSDADKRMYHLDQPPQFFNYLRKSECFDVPSINDYDELTDVVNGMQQIGMTQDEISQIFRVVSAVLWVGQIEFYMQGDKVRVRDDVALNTIGELLQMPPKEIRKAMVSRNYQAVHESMQTGLSAEQAVFTRDAFAKMLYSRLFNWVVGRINSAMDPTTMAQYSRKKELTLGVLDIYGFEIFEQNSFEQFCINYVNEKLQQVFIENTLKAEQEEYAREGIQWEEISYFNNKIVCDLIEAKPIGIIAFCDEECTLGRGSDNSFLDKISQNFRQHPHFVRSGGNHPTPYFIVKHYAGDVEYNVDGFLEKNKDLLWRDLMVLGEESGLPIVQNMFPKGAASKRKKRPETQGTQFRRQVNDLVSLLKKCEPHYIRCIKPNDSKRAGFFENDRVLHQVQYLGLLENVRVRRAGFAFRMEYPRFLRRYKMLSEATWPRWYGDDAQGTVEILNAMGFDQGSQYQMGRTKVFIRKPESLFSLEERRDRKLPSIAAVIQKAWRRYSARKRFLEMRDKALSIYGGKKRRRKNSVQRRFRGEYIAEDMRITAELRKYGDTRILFSAEIDKINRRFKTQPRYLILTSRAIYHFNEKFKFRRRTEINQIGSMSLSTNADDYMAIHIPSEYDYCFKTRFKTELVTAIKAEYEKLTNGNQVQINIADSYQFKTQKGKMLSVAFVKQPPVSGGMQDHMPSKAVKDQLDVYVNIPESEMASNAEIDGYRPHKMKQMSRAEKQARMRPHLQNQNNGYNSGGGGGSNNYNSPAANSSGGGYSSGGGGGGGLKTYGSNNNKSSYGSGNSGYGGNTGYKSGGGAPQEQKAAYNDGSTWAVATHDYIGQSEEELSFRAGQRIKILSQDADGWWSGEINGFQRGYVPYTYVEVQS